MDRDLELRCRSLRRVGRGQLRRGARHRRRMAGSARIGGTHIASSCERVAEGRPDPLACEAHRKEPIVAENIFENLIPGAAGRKKKEELEAEHAAAEAA